MGSHEEEPPPIAPYPFWQSGPPRRPPVRTGPPAQAPAPYDPDEDLPTAAHDVFADDDAPTQAFTPEPAAPASPAPEPVAAPAPAATPVSRRARRLQREPEPAGRGSAGGRPPLALPPDEDAPPAHDLEVHRDDGRSLAPGTAELLQDLRAEDGDGGALRRERRPEAERVPRSLILASAAAAVVVLVIAVVALVGGGDGDGSKPPGDTSAAKAVATLQGGQVPKDLAPLTADAAQQAMAAAKATAPGTVVEAMGWTDKNGRNAVVTTTETSSGGITLRVVQIAGLEGTAKELRTMRDPDLPVCATKGSGGTATFTPKAMAVRDLDGDGVAEVVTGWSSTCGGDDQASTIRLALLSNGEKYIIRGKGVIGSTGEGESAPDPAASRWPDGYLSALTTYYRALYY